MNANFVGREKQASYLQELLDKAIGGKGQVVFVSGEAGMGKTELVREFARNAQLRDPALVFAIGECNALTGQVDPYLPFKEILAQLTGDVDDKLAEHVIDLETAKRLKDLLAHSGEVIVELGPDLIDIFIPGAGLLSRAGVLLARKAGWANKLKENLSHRERSESLDQSRLYEQYARVIVKLAEQHHLLLMLDDLQWADDSSIELLFHLARRMGDHSIMIVGTYRPCELAQRRHTERHPLLQVINELCRYYGEIVLDLDASQASGEGKEFIDQLIAAEPNALSEEFKQALFEHTEGNPLFTIELLRYFQDIGILVKDGEGKWVQTRPISLSDMPPRVEAVLEERISRLGSDLRDALACASVAGPTFMAQVVARVQQQDERHLLRSLAQDLVKQLKVLSESGIVEVGRARLYAFRFRHILFQQHLYKSLSSFERELLHREVGQCLEDIYGDRADDIAVQLAWHFSEGHDDIKAIRYLEVAGQQAWREFSNSTALQHYRHLLQIVERQPRSADTNGRKLSVLTVLGDIHKHMGSYDEAEKQYRAAEQLAVQLDEPLKRAWTLNGLADVIRFRGDYQDSERMYHQSLAIAERIRDDQLVLENCNDLTSLYFGRAIRMTANGELASARSVIPTVMYLCSRIIALAQKASDYGSLKRVYKSLGNVVRLIEGEHTLALKYYGRSLELARQHGLDLDALCSVGQAYLSLGDYEQAHGYLAQYLAWTREIGSRRLEVVAHYNIGLILEAQKVLDEAQASLDESLHLNTPMVFKELAIRAWMVKGLIAEQAGNIDIALEFYRQGIRLKGQEGRIKSDTDIFRMVGTELLASETSQHAVRLLQRCLDGNLEASERTLVQSLVDSAQQLSTPGTNAEMGLEDELKVWVRSRVSSSRYQHILGVYTTVSKLAARHGVDAMPLRLAALLHDCARDMPTDKMLSLAEEWGLSIRPVDRQSPILLHRALASDIAQRELGISHPVMLSAILTHTSGHKSMSKSDKVFFLADLTEPTRQFPRVDDLRAATQHDIDQAMLLAIEINLTYLTGKDAVVDPDTIELQDVLRRTASGSKSY